MAIKIIDKMRFPTKQEAALKNEVSILQVSSRVSSNLQGGPKKGCSQKTKIGHGGFFFEKKSMTNKIKKFL